MVGDRIDHDFRTRFIQLADEINLNRPYHVVVSTAAALNRERRNLNGSRVPVLDLAYEKDVDDLRESPPLTIIELLQEEGAAVSCKDPYFEYIGRGRTAWRWPICVRKSCALRFCNYRNRPPWPRLPFDRAPCLLIVDTCNAAKAIRSFLRSCTAKHLTVGWRLTRKVSQEWPCSASQLRSMQVPCRSQS